MFTVDPSGFLVAQPPSAVPRLVSAGPRTAEGGCPTLFAYFPVHGTHDG
jgi:hypothetical protein